jgi:hypothetical protein
MRSTNWIIAMVVLFAAVGACSDDPEQAGGSPTRTGSGGRDASSAGGSTAVGGAGGRATGGAGGNTTVGGAGGTAMGGASMTGGAGGNAGAGGATGGAGASGSSGSAGADAGRADATLDGGGTGGSAGTGSGGTGPGGAAGGGIDAAGGNAGSGGGTGTGGADGGVWDGAGRGGAGGSDAGTGAPARGNITLPKVVISQGVEIAIVKDGALVAAAARNASLISKRAALVQGYWAVPSGWTARPILGKLHLKYTDNTETVLENTVIVSGAPVAGDRTKTFNWLVPVDRMLADVQFLVRLEEGEPGHDNIPASTLPPQAPSAGMAALGVSNDTVELKIVIAPVAYSSAKCTTNSRDILTADRLVELDDYMYARAPVQDVKLSVRAANINFSGTTWMSLLQSLQQARVDDNAQPNDYYYAMLNSCGVPLEGFGGYSLIPGDTKGDASRRVSSGEWRTATNKAEFSRVTYVHELGHGQGLRHAPCGNPAGPDPNYPYAGAKIGVWGYDLVKSTFKDPAKTTDYMSYCYEPSWPSDWTWAKNYKRAVTLTSWGPVPLPPEQGELLFGVLGGSGIVEEWWTAEGTLDPGEVTPGHEVEFYQGNRLVTRAPASLAELPEGGGKYILAQAPANFGAITNMVRVANGVRHSIAQTTVRRIIR